MLVLQGSSGASPPRSLFFLQSFVFHKSIKVRFTSAAGTCRYPPLPLPPSSLPPFLSLSLCLYTHVHICVGADSHGCPFVCSIILRNMAHLSLAWSSPISPDCLVVSPRDTPICPVLGFQGIPPHQHVHRGSRDQTHVVILPKLASDQLCCLHGPSGISKYRLQKNITWPPFPCPPPPVMGALLFSVCFQSCQILQVTRSVAANILPLKRTYLLSMRVPLAFCP